MKYYENIIIGAGPAGLQCSYFFKKYNIPYLILERNNLCGSFFNSYPHSGKLISINKKYTGNDNKDFNLRHDWNSLLNDDDFLFNIYSDNFYPNREVLLNYLNDFAKKYELQIKFNRDVYKIEKDNTADKYIIYVKNKKKIKNSKNKKNSKNEKNEKKEENYSCKNLIIASGLSKPYIPPFKMDVKDPIKHYADYPQNYFLDKDNLEEFKAKTVLIIGGGNSSFELANILNEISKSVFVVGRNNRNWAMSSHYGGDIRSIYLPFMDTFLLKVMNAIDYNKTFDKNNLLITQNDKGLQYKVSIIVEDLDEKIVDFIPGGRNSYDKIIICTGWNFDNSIYNFDIAMTKNNKFPLINYNYESVNNKNLFFIGSLMHSVDFRKSSGGFLSGFRYLIKFFININYQIPFDYVEFNFTTKDDIIKLVDHIIYRINTSSDMYQMFGYLGDIFYYNLEEEKIHYFKNVHINGNYFKNDINIIIFKIKLDFGERETDIMKVGEKKSFIGSESRAHLIHPILKIYNSYPLSIIDIIHFDEELFSEFTDTSKYHEKLFRILKSFLP
jgi:thioredoxin reductase